MKKKKINKETKKYKLKLEKRELKKKDKEWSLLVKQRDENKCIICDDIKYLHTHHLFPREIKKFRHEILNGVTLCAKHHKYSYEISAHKNSITFLIWLKENRKEQWEFLINNNIYK